MEKNLDYKKARDILLESVSPVGTEEQDLEECEGRVLAQRLAAAEDVPPFARSAYDGYAFRAEDTREASREHPVTLKVLEEIKAGEMPVNKINPGTAAKILTGAPVPEGADAVVMYEKTQFDADTVTLFFPAESGGNIISAGEDVRAGTVLAEPGTVIDAGAAGALASQGIARPLVYRRPRIGIISTGSELLEPGEKTEPAKIRNSNRYIFSAVLRRDGCEPVYLGKTKDSAEEICRLLEEGMYTCDMVLLTGGVSAGDYDLTPAGMEQAGIELLAGRVRLKPGMACAYGVKDGKLVCALSGNPASAAVNYYAVVRPAVWKLAGRRDWLPAELQVVLKDGFPKKSRMTRMLRGKLQFAEGRIYLSLPSGQGNTVISSMIGNDAMAVVPEGSGPLPAGTVLQAFLIG